MPPQGESTGLAVEDAVLLARILQSHTEAKEDQSICIRKTISKYIALRTSRIDAAFEEANMRWENAKDAGWLLTMMKEWLARGFLWWTEKARDESYRYDVREIGLE